MLYNVAVTRRISDVAVLEVDYGVLYKGPNTSNSLGLDKWTSFCWKPKSLDAEDITYFDAGRQDQGPWINTTNRAWCGSDARWPGDVFGVLGGTWKYLMQFDGNSSWSGGVSNTDILQDIYNLAGLTMTLPNIVKSLTYAATHETNSLGYSAIYVRAGNMWTDKTFVRIRWPWLALPISLNAIGVVFLDLHIGCHLQKGRPVVERISVCCALSRTSR